MGTDIHYYAEKRTGDHWEPAFQTYYEDENDLEDRSLWHGEQFYFGSDRNYELYQILSWTVDSDTGLTSRGFAPISPPRGLPADLSPEIRMIARDPNDPETWEKHSLFGHSWLLLRELMDFPWKETFRRFIGFVNAEDYSLFRAGKPFRMQQVSPRVLYGCKDLDAYPKPEWNVVSNEQMEQMIRAATEPVSDRLWTQIEYQESYAIPGHHILADTIPKLSKVGAPVDVRVIFWFSC